jgi:hypothetical protein
MIHPGGYLEGTLQEALIKFVRHSKTAGSAAIPAPANTTILKECPEVEFATNKSTEPAIQWLHNSVQ